MREHRVLACTSRSNLLKRAARVWSCASPASVSSRPERAGFLLRSSSERRPT
jgi:hypothetical protein